MPNLFNTDLSAAELTERILALNEPDRTAAIESLRTAVISRMQAAAKTENKKKILDKIASCRQDQHCGGANSIALVSGALRRASVEPLESLAIKEPHEISEILAGATKLSPVDRTMIKGLLYRLSAIPQ